MTRHAITAAAVGVGAAILIAASAHANPQVDQKLQANKFVARLVQAFAECDSGGSSVTSLAGLSGELACADGELDGTPFAVGKLIVRHKVFPPNGFAGFARKNIVLVLKSSGTQEKKDTGIPPLAGKDVRVRLTLRISETVSEAGVPVDPETSDPSQQFTFTDKTVTCPASTVPANGNLVQRTSLINCTPQISTVLMQNTTSKEIIAASVIDANTGLAIASPGIRRKIRTFQ